MDLKIFKKKDPYNNKRGQNFEDLYTEYSDNDKPLITCTFTEDATEGLWKLYLGYALENF
jgi:hypothetical protein